MQNDTENKVTRKEITIKEVSTLDKSQIKSITLKDGKVILINNSQSSQNKSQLSSDARPLFIQIEDPQLIEKIKLSQSQNLSKMSSVKAKRLFTPIQTLQTRTQVKYTEKSQAVQSSQFNSQSQQQNVQFNQENSSQGMEYAHENMNQNENVNVNVEMNMNMNQEENEKLRSEGKLLNEMITYKEQVGQEGQMVQEGQEGQMVQEGQMMQTGVEGQMVQEGVEGQTNGTRRTNDANRSRRTNGTRRSRRSNDARRTRRILW